MGNEKSQPVGLVIEEKAIQADNFWTLHSATYGTEGNRKVTVFLGATDNGNKPSALERFSKNIMIHRHPNILKYVASWKVNGQYHLATEEVCPLTQVLSQQTPLQLCIGLHSILKALNFLHEKAASSHNNICQAAVYVNPEGQWKLGGMEYLCRFSDVSAGFLAESRSGRYERGVSPGEESRVPQPPSAIDLYAFGVLVEEILLPRTTDDVPGMSDFLDMCRRQLQSGECSARPSLSVVLGHNFFNHQFISIYSFLAELPLKTEIEKQHFFRDLSNKLSEYSEQVVASQLGSLLLSRIVLLDVTAQQYLLPHILNPKSDQRPEALFSEKVFREHIVPRLMSIYCVRDIQVRLTLLTHFKSFCRALTHSQLQSRILPELLVGIKDTNDNLVTATLIALADLVPILGAATVIGGKRTRHFSDGRPKAIRQTRGSNKKIGRAVKSAELNTSAAGVANGVEDSDLFLSERPSPDGGEAQSTGTVTEDESETWDNWDALQPAVSEEQEEAAVERQLDASTIDESVGSPTATVVATVTEGDGVQEGLKTPEESPAKNGEIKLQKKVSSSSTSKNVEEVDFFSDMEPVISKADRLLIDIDEIKKGPDSKEPEERLKNGNNKFEVSPTTDLDTEGGWGDELEWADVSDLSSDLNKSVEPT